jgi:hypothetical protein
LGKKGEVYLFHFTEIGYREEFQISIEGMGAFGLEMIDPWEMKNYSLGHAKPGTHTFTLPFVPNLLRAVQTTVSAPGAKPLASVQELLKRWESIQS